MPHGISLRLKCALGLFAAWAQLHQVPALARIPQLDGWWHAEIQQAGDVSDVYLHFVHDAAGEKVALTIPLAGIAATDMRSVKIVGDRLEVPDVKWTFELGKDGATLVTWMPPVLVPVHRIKAVFHRSAAPALPAPVSAVEVAPAPSWTYQAGAPVWGGIAYDPARDWLAVGTDAGKVIALQGSSGAVVWSTDLGASVRAMPVFHGNDLYVSTDTKLVKLDASTGRLLWTSLWGPQLKSRLPTTDPHAGWDHYGSEPVVRDEVVYATSRDGCLHAVGSDAGTERWKLCTGALLTGTPALTDDRILFGSFDHHLYAVDSVSGKLTWKRDLLGVIPREIVVSGRTALAGSRSYDLFAVDVASGQPVWRNYFWYSWVDSVPVIRDGTLFIGSSDATRVFALDAQTGKRRWACPLPGWAWPRPGVAATSVYAGVVGGSRYLASRQGALAAIDRENGKLRWLYAGHPDQKAELFGFAAAPAVAGHRVFAADLGGLVYALDDTKSVSAGSR